MLLMAAEQRRAARPPDSLPDLRGAGNRGAEKPLALTSARRQSRLAPGGAGVPGEARGSPALCSPCVTSDSSQAQSLLDEVGP